MSNERKTGRDIHLLVVGRGKMATLIRDECVKAGISYEILPDGPQKNTRIEPGKTVVVHVGSGRVLLDTIDWCEINYIPLIQASSSLKNADGEVITLPDNVRVQVINAPNLALLITALLNILPRFGYAVQLLDPVVGVTESHQSTKTSAPITAQKIAGNFGLPPGAVVSVRDPDEQRRRFGVPEEHLGGHAIHEIEIRAGGVDMTISVRVFGRHAYFDGLLIVVDKLFNDIDGNALPPGIYELDKFMFGQLPV